VGATRRCPNRAASSLTASSPLRTLLHFALRLLDRPPPPSHPSFTKSAVMPHVHSTPSSAAGPRSEGGRTSAVRPCATSFPRPLLQEALFCASSIYASHPHQPSRSQIDVVLGGCGVALQEASRAARRASNARRAPATRCSSSMHSQQQRAVVHHAGQALGGH
jgi:hypothetical protein